MPRKINYGLDYEDYGDYEDYDYYDDYEDIYEAKQTGKWPFQLILLIYIQKCIIHSN